ncbi:MAG: acyl-CoA dehydratase activase-related protein [Patescibacteria group bacterium]
MVKRTPVVSFPYIGKYTSVFKDFLESLDIKVILPPKITDKTIKIGTKYSSEMMCFPYKVTLGNFIELLENHPEIDYLIMYDSQGRCRFRHYHILQKQMLEKLGFKKAKMLALNYKTLLKLPKTINHKLNTVRIIKNYYELYKKIKQISKHKEFSKNKPNILIIGEIYTSLEPTINYFIEERLENLGVNFINSVDLFSFLKDNIKYLTFGYGVGSKYYLQARSYFNGPLGGHGIENIASLLEYLDKGIDGVIWLRPLSCMPETTVDPIIKNISQEKNIPLLTFDIDESNFALNIETRLETFIEQVKLDYETKK